MSFGNPFTASALPRWRPVAVVALLFTLATIPLLTLRGSEAREFRYTTWKAEQGLPQNSVKAIHQTMDGYLWFSTRFGIVRFDGVTFRVFDRVNTPGIGEDNGISLAEEADGTLWIASPYGVTRYRNRAFTYHTVGARDDAERLWSISPAREGGIWIASSDGLKRLHNNTVTRYSTADGLNTNMVISVFEDSTGVLWAGTEAGLQRRDKVTGRFQDAGPPSLPVPIRLQCIYQDRQGALWIGTVRGLHRLKDGQWVHFVPRPDSPNDQVEAITEDRQGNLWITTRAGALLRFRDGRFERFGKAEGLSDDWVLCLKEDREGNLWVGTNFGGLNRMQPRHIAAFSVLEGLSHNNTWSICQSRDGGLWIGSDGGVSYFKDGRFTNFQVAENPQRRPVKSVLEDRTGTVWVGVKTEGVKCLRDGRVIRSYSTRNGLSHDHINAIYEDHQGRIWIGTQEGVNCVENGVVRTYTAREGLSNGDVRAIHQDRAGDVWVATYGGGVNRLHSGRFTALTVAEGLSDNWAWAIREDSEGVLWIATERGLNRLRNGHVTTFTVNEGLFDNTVNDMPDDDLGNLWISCNRGIYRVRKDELTAVAEGRARRVSYVSYGASDGMLSSETNGENQPAACKTRDGKLWFPTTEGIVMIDPGKITNNDLPPQVVLEDVSIDNESLDLGGPGRLPPGRGDVIEFRYTANSLVAPEKVRFKYRLDGYDNEWTDALDRRVAYYTNLRPGHYAFRVIACNNHGLWNEAGASFAFHLAPHFYQTVPFYVFCALAVVATGYGLHRLRVSVVRKIERLEQQHALEKERTRIAHEMHDDLGSSLTQIALLGELATRDLEKTAQAGEHIRKITSTTREVFRAMDEIVWAVNPRHDTLASLADYLCKYAQDFLRTAGIRCRLDLPETLPAIPLSTDQRHNLFLTVKEALNNIVKHASASEVWLRVKADEASCKITIEDNGRGFTPESARPAGNGLASMRERLAVIDGHLELHSEPGRGTRIELSTRLKPIFEESSRI